MASTPFMSALNDLLTKYAATQTPPGTVAPDLAAFVGWVLENPPVEVAPVKGEPRDSTSATGRVWAYLDQLVADKVAFTRKGACDALIGEGLNASTVATQYQRWAKTRGYKAPAPAASLPKPAAVAVPPTVHKAQAPEQEPQA